MATVITADTTIDLGDAIASLKAKYQSKFDAAAGNATKQANYEKALQKQLDKLYDKADSFLGKIAAGKSGSLNLGGGTVYQYKAATGTVAVDFTVDGAAADVGGAAPDAGTILGGGGSTASTAVSTASTAVSTASTAVSTASTAVSTASTAVSTASTAVSTASTAAASTAGVTYTLTTGPDYFSGTVGDDTIRAYVSNSAAADFTATNLTLADDIHGGAGTDTLEITLGNTAAVTPIMSSVEVVNVRTVSTETAQINLQNAGTAAIALNIAGVSDIIVAGLNTAANVTFSGGFVRTATIGLAADTTADTLTINLNDGNPDLVATAFETVKLNLGAGSTAYANTESLNIATAQTLSVSGTANVTLNLGIGSGNGRGAFTGTGVSNASAVGSLKTVNATALVGNLTLVASTAGVDQVLLGGAGDDKFYMSAQFNQSDSIDGGAGSDTVIWTNPTSGTFRPVIQGVETLTVDFGADATIDLRNASAASISTLNVEGVASTALFSALASATKTINITSALSAGVMTFNYSAAAASDVVVNLTNDALSTSTASYSVGDLTLANNTGSLTLNAVGSATGQAVDAFAANNASTLTINVTSGQFVASAVNANVATAVTLNVNNGKTASITGNASFTAASLVTINASGATANIDMADLTIGVGATNALTVTLGAGTTGLTMGTLNLGAQTASATFNDTVTINNQGSGIVTLSGIDLDAAGSATGLTLNLNVTQAGSGAQFNANFAGATLGGSANLNITLAGQGQFNLTGAGVLSAGSASTVVFNSTAVSTGVVSANFTASTDADLSFDVRLGAHSAVIALGAGADKVQFGLNNQQSVRGGAGNDELTMNNTAVSIAQYSNTATASAPDSGTDTIFGAGSGDIILFQGFGTGTAASGILKTAITTGTGWAVSTAASTTAQVFGTTLVGIGQSAAAIGDAFMAMYTAAGDMIIEVQLATGTANAFSADAISKIVLNGKGDVAKTALLRIDTNGSGLLLTLL